MKIEKVVWISRAGQEAEIHLSGGELTCVAFCQPCEYKEGTSVTGPLHAFMTKNVMLSYGEDSSLKRITSSSFAHKITAWVLDQQRAIVEAGGFEIELDEGIPAGVGVGDLVDFECARLDLW